MSKNRGNYQKVDNSLVKLHRRTSKNAVNTVHVVQKHSNI